MKEHLTDVKKAAWTLVVEGREYAEHLKASNVAGYTIVEDMANEIQRLREDLRRTESARIAILAENKHYKREAAEANEMLNSEWFARVTYKRQLRAALDEVARLETHIIERQPIKVTELPAETTGDGAK